MKEVIGRKVELDEVTVPAPLLESSTSQKSVLVTTTPISEEANDDDHVTSYQVTTESSSTFLPLTSFERNSFSRKDQFKATNILSSDL